MKRGEIWRVRIPFASGHAQAGDRPGLIVQNDAFLATLPTVLIVPFTSTAGAGRFAGTFPVQPDSQNGLTLPSIALVFQTRAVDKRDCILRLGFVDDPTMDQITDLLNKLMSL
jgi:mRNA interferase MazF